MGSKQVCVAFARIADLGCLLGASPLNKQRGCWEYQIDEHWFIAVNGHKAPTKTKGGVEVEPYNCYVEFNGWPAGLFTPFGGAIAAGEAANEDAFIKALDEAILTNGWSEWARARKLI